MKLVYEFNEITFEEFVTKLKNFSDKKNIRVLEIGQDRVVFEWDESMLAYDYQVEVYDLGKRRILVYYERNGFVKFVLVLSIFMLMLAMKGLYWAVGVVFVMFGVLFYTDMHYCRRAIIRLLDEVENMEELKPDNVKAEGLFCPGCGCELTPYDEVCPCCGLYIGSKQKQPSDRTRLYDYRLKYVYKRKAAAEDEH